MTIELDPDEKQKLKDRPVYASRFQGWHEFRARLYRRCLREGIAPPTVDLMRPTQVAAVLELDLTDEVLSGVPPVQARSQEAVPPPPIPEWVDLSVPRAERMAGKTEVTEIGEGPAVG